MNKYLVTIESQEYNPKKHEWEAKQFTGEFEGESTSEAKKNAKEYYAFELDTEPNEIKVIKAKLIFDIVHEVVMAMDEVAMAKGLEQLNETCDELIKKFKDYHEILNYLSNKYGVNFN